jgi:hypothetical protein
MISSKHIVRDMNNGSHIICDDAEEAANEILTHDGYFYEVRSDPDGGFSLWTSSQSRAAYGNARLIESVIFSIEKDEEIAKQDIWKRVCAGVNGEAFGAAAATYCETLDSYLSSLNDQLADLDAEDEEASEEIAELKTLIAEVETKSS